MQNLKTLFKRPLQAVPSSLVITILVIALIGFVDAGYLTMEHYQGVIPPCTIVSGCEKVLTSSYSIVLGVPVSLLGVIFYAIVAAGTFAYLEGKHEKIFRFSLIVALVGIVASLWFLFVQAFLLQSYCLYCLGSAVTSTILFVLACVVFKKYGDKTYSSQTA